MSTVILDTNIYVRACAIEVQDPESAFLRTSRHDHFSDPVNTKGGLSPRQCRALILHQMAGANRIIMPAQQADEILKVTENMRRRKDIAPHNDTLLKCVDQFARTSSIGHRVPVLVQHIHQQYAVLKEALSIAATISDTGPVERRRRAQHFLEKNQHHLISCLPEPNIERLRTGRAPFVFNDWLLMHAAKRMGTVLITIDRDFEFLSDAYVRVMNYNPAKVLEYYPGFSDVNSFRAVFSPPAATAPQGPEM